jgi:hypothetical protein
MAEPTQTATAPAPVAPVATQEVAPVPKPKADFRDVKIRRISQSDGTAPVKVDPPMDSIPRATQPPAAGAGSVNADGVARTVDAQGVTAGETAEVSEPKPTTSIERQFKALHKQKQKIRAREEALKSAEAKLKDYDELVALRAKDEVAFLDRIGLDASKVAEAKKKLPNDPRMSAHEQRIADLEAKLAAKETEALEAQKASTLAEIRSDLQRTIVDKRDEYKHLNAYSEDAQQDVYKTVLTFEEVHGRLPTSEDVTAICKKVDGIYKAKHEAAQKVLGGTAPAPGRAVTAPSSLSTLRSAQQPAPNRILSKAERIHEAAEIFRSVAKSQ